MRWAAISSPPRPARRDGLVSERDFFGRIPAHPTGAAVCEVEIDPATGESTICAYAQVDDVGQAINPMIVEGQTHGGIAQGLGQAFFEGIGYDPESGALYGGSFMQYPVPRAHQLPALRVELAEDPTGSNPLRIKGGGEGGITPSPAAAINAVCDALRPTTASSTSTRRRPRRKSGRSWPRKMQARPL